MRILLVLLLVGAALSASACGNPPAELQTVFAPPAEYAGKFGPYKSPLKFYDGRRRSHFLSEVCHSAHHSKSTR